MNPKLKALFSTMMITALVFGYADIYCPLELYKFERLHVFASLYGWNLCGLAVICRFNDFPIKLHSSHVIAAHWLTALLLTPLGTFYPPFAFLAIIGYAFITITLFFSSNKGKV